MVLNSDELKPEARCVELLMRVDSYTWKMGLDPAPHFSTQSTADLSAAHRNQSMLRRTCCWRSLCSTAFYLLPMVALSVRLQRIGSISLVHLRQILPKRSTI